MLAGHHVAVQAGPGAPRRAGPTQTVKETGPNASDPFDRDGDAATGKRVSALRHDLLHNVVLAGLSAHAFRHTFASLLIVGLKLDPVMVAKQLGRSNPATTLSVYAHLFDRARHADETRDALDEQFGHLLAVSAPPS